MEKNKDWEKLKNRIGSAQSYECNLVPELLHPIAELFLKYLPIKKGESVLDVACGTGIIAKSVAPIVGEEGSVVGVDIDKDMIEVAQSNASPNFSIDWHIGNAEDMSFIANESFDWVVCQLGYQYFLKKHLALVEMHRVLKPEGRIAMFIPQCVNQDNQPYQWAKVEANRKHVSFEAGEKLRNTSQYYYGTEDDLRNEMKMAGFSAINIHNVVYERKRETPEKMVNEEDYADLDPEARTAVVADIRSAIEVFRTKEGTVIPYGFHIAIGSK